MLFCEKACMPVAKKKANRILNFIGRRYEMVEKLIEVIEVIQVIQLVPVRELNPLNESGFISSAFF